MFKIELKLKDGCSVIAIQNPYKTAQMTNSF